MDMGTDGSQDGSLVKKENVEMDAKVKNEGGIKIKGKNNSSKPLSTTSPEAIAAGKLVTPVLLSDLLLRKGPLAIRYITNTLSLEIPSFKDLSLSKQRRLIMSALEAGDEKNSVVFEKIGWGQWTAKVIEDPSRFLEIRNITNTNNSKIKEIIIQEKENKLPVKKESFKNSMTQNEHKLAIKEELIKKFNNNIPFKGGYEQKVITREIEKDFSSIDPLRSAIFIDENAIITDDEDGDDQFIEEEYLNSDKHSTSKKTSFGDETRILVNSKINHRKSDAYYTFTDNLRRKPSIILTESTLLPKNNLDTADHEFFQQKSRNQRSKSYSNNNSRRPSIFKNSHIPISHVLNPNVLKEFKDNNNNNFSKTNLSPDCLRDVIPKKRNYSFSKESSMRSTLGTTEFPLNGSTTSPFFDTDDEDWEKIGRISLTIHKYTSCKDLSNSQESHIDRRKHSVDPSADEDNAACLLMSLKS